MHNSWMIFLVLIIFQSIYAKDLGVFGDVYPIKEEDLLQYIYRTIKEKQQNGEWERHTKDLKSKISKNADRPKAVILTKAYKQRSWFFDPTITLENDLKDHNGTIFAKAGVKFNPLDMVHLKRALIFFDGNDTKQVSWVKRKNKELQNQTKLILINGSISLQEKDFQQKIFFDQDGKLTKHFKIEHVPAIITQEGYRLKIIEDVV